MQTERTDRVRNTENGAAESLQAGADAQGKAESPARQTADKGDDQAGKRGRQKMARLVRMHGGLVIEGGR
ncbi:hypothetical protein MPPM_4816 [Methylorubrum populi]|uniref:Uncharacterized protein n=1 Tax=Methylorubrum populi TaxID=223967 RepID=A0A160PM03_9HYPH|nr:hypothetical protein MPPM_4816 [Methylorubrum populi]